VTVIARPTSSVLGKDHPSTWWRLLPRALNGPLEPADLVELLSDLLPGASRIEVQVDTGQEAWGTANKRQEHITADIVTTVPCGRLEATLPAEQVEEGQAILDLVAGLIAQRFALAELTHFCERARDLVTAGEAAGALVHAVNNHLNSMLMQAMVLQMRLQGDLAERIDAIRQEGKIASARLRPVQALRLWPGSKTDTADLVSVVQRVLARTPDLSRRVQVRLPEQPVRVRGTAEGLERLIAHMLRVGLRCLGADASVVLAVGERGVALELPISGSSEQDRANVELPPESLAGIGELEREAIHWLARQLAARVEIEPAGFGLVWRVSWPE
jgi:hypothetical protein